MHAKPKSSRPTHPILVTGAAGRVGAVGRTIAELLLKQERKAGIRVFYALHRRYRLGDYETWKYIAPIQKAAWLRKSFEYGTWGGEIRREFEPQPGEIVAQEALVLQRFRQHGFGSAAQETRYRQAHRHGAHSTYVWRQAFVIALSLATRSPW